MASIMTRQTTETDTPVDSDYCYSQAAQALTSLHSVGSPLEVANQWRLLGDSLFTKETSG